MIEILLACRKNVDAVSKAHHKGETE